MPGQRPGMDPYSFRISAGPSVSPDPLDPVVPPSPHFLHQFMNGEKAGVLLLFFGLCLALLGIIFTVLGWQHHTISSKFELNLLLGPIFITIGGTFVLASVCTIGPSSCLHCRRSNRDTSVTPTMEQSPPGHCFTLNQPIMLRSNPTMFYIPPPYNFGNQEESERQHSHSVNGVFPALDNLAFTGGEEVDHRRCRLTQQTEEERQHHPGGCSTCAPPPAYDDIYPPTDKQGPA